MWLVVNTYSLTYCCWVSLQFFSLPFAFSLDLSIITFLFQFSRSSYLYIHIHTFIFQLWDVSNTKLVRRMKTHESRVDSLAWSPKTSLLSSGDQQGFIHHYNPRMAQFHVASVRAHQMDVCGLQWSPNGRFLASGGNDNVVKIWDTYSKDTWNSPAHTIKHHTAAVKVLIGHNSDCEYYVMLRKTERAYAFLTE